MGSVEEFQNHMGFAIAILLAILSVVLAVKGNGYWVVLFVLATILTFLSVNRADKVYKYTTKLYIHSIDFIEF